MTTITLTSHDGLDVKLPKQAALMSETVRNLMEDAGDENPIPLPNVNGNILIKVVEYCVYHAENPTPSNMEKGEKRTDDIIPWDLDYMQLDKDTLFQLILAANYMDIKPLLDLGCQTVANMIKGKTPKEIRHTFGITGDFTPEEEEQVRKENEWVEER